MPQMFDDVGEIVDEALRRVGNKVVLALPLGIGKPNLIANEFFRRARADASLDLTIFTALSLRKPSASGDLEKRFVGPLAERLFGNYPDLDYLAAVRADKLPANVRVIEFFFEPGSLLNSTHAQSHYLSANYTNLTHWPFPAGNITPGQFLVVFCDGQSGQTTAAEYHTSFRLPAGSGTIVLSRLVGGEPQVID